MEGQRYHRPYLAEVHDNGAAVPRGLRRVEPPVAAGPSVQREVFLHPLVRAPYRAPAGGLRRHHVYAVSEFDGQARNSGADEFHHAVLDEAVFENRADYRERDVLRPDARARRSFQINRGGLGARQVVGAAEQLLDELRPALADAHRAKRAVARVAVGAEYHAAAARHRLAHVGVYDSEMRGDEVAAEPFRRGEAEGVVVLVYRAADGAERIMAVRQYVGHREFFQTARHRRLDYADVGDVVRGEGVEAYFVLVRRNGGIVRGDYPRRNRAARRLIRALWQAFELARARRAQPLVDACEPLSFDLSRAHQHDAAEQENSAVYKLYHHNHFSS